MTKTEALHWKNRRSIAAEKEKELLRQTPVAVRLRQLQAMFSTVRIQNWQVSSPEDVFVVRARWNRLRQIAKASANHVSNS